MSKMARTTKPKFHKSAKGDDEFTPSRIVADLKLDLGDSTTESVNLDDVHIKIPYAGAEPTIGWWNGAKWVKFKQVTYANHISPM